MTNYNVMDNHLNLLLKLGQCSVENCVLQNTNLPKSVDKIWRVSGTGYELISFSSIEECGIFETAMTMQWHLTLVTQASCLASFLIRSKHCMGFGKFLFACNGRNLLCNMDAFLCLECCWITTSWHPSFSVVTLWCHTFKNVSGLCTCVCRYSYIFPSSVCIGLC